MKKKGFTLIELLVVIAIIAMLLAILMPALNKVKKIAQRVVCGTNLKGLGTAQSVYSSDYEDQYAKQGGSATTLNWSRVTPKFDDPAKKWSNSTTTMSVGASLYLLVREADVSPKSFVCGAGGQSAYDGKNSFSMDLVELYDFGNPTILFNNQPCGGGPEEHVSYSYHNPFSRFPASGASSASFAIMADRNPWFDPKLTEGTLGAQTQDTFSGTVTRMGAYWDLARTPPQTERWQIQIANSNPHGREGQNVAFGDGHSEYAKTADVGVKHDNIYTKQAPAVAGNEEPVRCGIFAVGTYKAPPAGPAYGSLGDFGNAATYPNYQPASAMDSLLINDSDTNP